MRAQVRKRGCLDARLGGLDQASKVWCVGMSRLSGDVPLLSRMTHLGSRRPPKIFHSTGPDFFQMWSLDSYTAAFCCGA